MSDDLLLLSRDGVERVQAALDEMDLDGWLLYDFHEQNPIARALLGLEWTTRRAFVLIPRSGTPRALIHAIESSSWRHWTWDVERYAGWREMEERLSGLLDGMDRVAMETSPRDSVPTLDRVPGGVLDLIRELGMEPVSSGDLVSRFHAVWSVAQLEEHRKAARVVQEVAAEAFRRAADGVERGSFLNEGRLSRWIRAELAARGLTHEVDCIVAVGPRAADPHYEPGETGETIGPDTLLLIDLWGATGPDAVPADQTWMGYLGEAVPAEVEEVWEAVRDARKAAVEFLRERHAAGAEVAAYEVDDVSRGVLEERGYGEYFVHRTGHSIDTELHGSGPNLDNLESRDDRTLVEGVGFSVEPGVYIPDRIGVRSEVNVHWGPDGPEVTTPDPQEEIFRFPGA